MQSKTFHILKFNNFNWHCQRTLFWVNASGVVSINEAQGVTLFK